MSKSDPSEMSRINLTTMPTRYEEGQEGQDRSRTSAERGKGSGGPRRSGEPCRDLWRADRARASTEVLADHGGKGFGAFKPALGEVLIETLGPINARF